MVLSSDPKGCSLEASDPKQTAFAEKGGLLMLGDLPSVKRGGEWIQRAVFATEEGVFGSPSVSIHPRAHPGTRTAHGALQDLVVHAELDIVEYNAEDQVGGPMGECVCWC